MSSAKHVLKNIVLWLLVLFPSQVFAASNPFAPPAGKTLLFVGQDSDTIGYYVHGTHTIPGGVMLYTSIQKMDGLDGPIDYGSGSMDGNDLLKTYPDSVLQLGLYLVDELTGTVLGIYDANLAALAQWIIQADRPVYLRIGYEFDNPSNHYDPQTYKQAFRHIVDYLRKAGVKNAAYVWHTHCIDHPGEQWMDWYPGDDYVDWFGVSIFSTQQIPIAANFQKLAQEHKKPFMICESSPWGVYTTRGKIDWLNHIFKFIKDQHVAAFCYINSNWDVLPMFQGQNIGDQRIQQYSEIKDLWLKEIGQDQYLKASPNLFHILGCIRSRSSI